MKPKVLLILILILSLVLTACTAVIVEEPNTTDTKNVSTISAAESTGEDTSDETTTGDIDTTAVDATETDTTEADTTEAEEPVELNPNQNYVGTWLSYPDTDSGSLTITSISSSSVLFSLAMTRGPFIKATAIEQDGKYVFGEDVSPDLEYHLYDYSNYDKTHVSGYLMFEENSVILELDSNVENVDGFSAELKTENFYGKRETAKNNAKSSLEAVGWGNIEMPTYDFSIKFDNAEPYSTERIPVKSVVGTTGDITAVIRVVYDRETDEWFTADAFYVSTSGKVLQGEALETFMTDHGKTDFILSADDADLLEYFK